LNNYKIAGIGEALWDIYGDEKTFGGAPANCACHCHTHGAEGYVISCLGNDDLGCETRKFLENHGVDLTGLAVSDKFPTGTVSVTLDEKGKPEYEINEGVAWDNIPFTDEIASLAPQMDAICFGTLAQRNDVSRKSIQKFLDATTPDCLRMLDINIRLDYYSDEIILSSLEKANALKINDEELPVVAKLLNISGSDEEQMHAIAEKCDLKLAILTIGPKGALMVKGGESNFSPCYDLAPVVSTVGAGDSFTATAIMGYLNNYSLEEINKHANLVASYVVTQVGAVPALPEKFKDPSEADKGYDLFLG
jgi:fructokinase